MLLVVIASGLLAALVGWYVQALRGPLSPALLAMQVVTTVMLTALFVAACLRLLPQRVLELCCLLYIVGICLVGMALRLYSQRYGAGIHIAALYLWIPVVYVFAFMLASHKTGLFLSLGIFALFVGVSLPYLVLDLDGEYANLTAQLHLVSAIMITMLYFFSSYQTRLRLAQVTVDQLAQLSITDDLTGLFNRRHMAAVINEELARLVAGGRGFALILFDVDNFKSVNDRFGHGTGDAALVALARCATELFRDMGALGRWGGDEFVALVKDLGVEDAVRMSEALCAHVASSPLSGGQAMTISCGVTVAEAGDKLDRLLWRADSALYAAKHAGRGRAESFLEPHAGQGRHESAM